MKTTEEGNWKEKNGFEMAVEILFENGTDHFKLKIASILAENFNKILNSEALEEIRVWLISYNTWEEISKIIVAITAFDPEYSHRWQSCLTRPLLELEIHEKETQKEKDYKQVILDRNFHIILGVILGIFKSAEWLSHNFDRETGFEKEMLDFLFFAIVSQSKFIPLGFEKKFESEVSKGIKAYVHGSQFNRDERLGDVCQLLKKIFAVLKQRKTSLDGSELSKIGGLILDQLSYAYFGTLGTPGRAKALADYIP